MDQYQQALENLEAKRSDGQRIPVRWPPGWVPMPVAAARMIDAWLPDDGGFVEALRFVLKFGRLHEIEDPDDPEYGPWMHRLAWRIADRFCEQARDGNLITGLRRVGGADEVMRMPREWWDVEDPLLRFRSFSIDPADRLAEGSSLPFWIWVGADSLETILARIPNEYRSASPAPGMPNAEFLKLDAIPLRDAVGVIADAAPAGQVAAAAAILVNLCATGVVQAYAGHMYRAVGDGRDVEAVPNWPIPAGHWEGLIDDARSDWNGGHLQAAMPPDVFRFRRVQIDRQSLFEALQSLGWVTQARVREPLRNIHWRGYATRSKLEPPSMPRSSDYPERTDPAEIERLAAKLDGEGVSKRNVDSTVIASRWNPEHGPVPKKESVTALMKGQPKGRRPVVD